MSQLLDLLIEWLRFIFLMGLWWRDIANQPEISESRKTPCSVVHFRDDLHLCHNLDTRRAFLKRPENFSGPTERTRKAPAKSFGWARSIQDHSTKISGNFGLKLNGSTRSKRKSFEKSGPPFRGGPLFSVGPVRSKLTVPFDLFDSFSIPIPHCSLRFIGVTRTYMCSNNNYKAVLRSVCFGR